MEKRFQVALEERRATTTKKNNNGGSTGISHASGSPLTDGNGGNSNGNSRSRSRSRKSSGTTGGLLKKAAAACEQ